MSYKPEHKKEKQAAAAARYRERHLKHVKAQQASWYEENREKSIARNRRWNERNPDGAFNSYLKRKYGITRAQYDTMLEAQDSVCAICRGPPVGTTRGGKPQTHLSVDHCHSTGRVRGLLCHLCNVMLGSSRDRPQVLQAAILYLERPENVHTK